jgi:hypothetical protein
MGKKFRSGTDECDVDNGSSGRPLTEICRPNYDQEETCKGMQDNWTISTDEFNIDYSCQIMVDGPIEWILFYWNREIEDQMQWERNDYTKP